MKKSDQLNNCCKKVRRSQKKEILVVSISLIFIFSVVITSIIALSKKPIKISDSIAEASHIDEVSKAKTVVDDDKFNEEASLQVINVAQYPSLPNGCEIVSATIVLNYLGFDITKERMATDFLPATSDLYGDPEKYYLGNPYSYNNGLYCYTKPIVTAINNYFHTIGMTDSYLKAYDLSGSSVETIKHNITMQRPVIVWLTIDMKSPSYHNKILTNLHCLVVTGYDEKYIYVSDPLEKLQKIDISTFEKIYKEMGQRAVVIR